MVDFAVLRDLPNAEILPLNKTPAARAAHAAPAITLTGAVVAKAAPWWGLTGQTVRALPGALAAKAAPRSQAMSDSKSTALQQAALKRGLQRHTQRYNTDATYRQQMEVNGTALCLRWESGVWILQDGSDARYY